MSLMLRLLGSPTSSASGPAILIPALPGWTSQPGRALLSRAPLAAASQPLAIDASTPAIAVQSSATVATVTTASFTPPAGSLLLIRYSANTVDPTSPATPTITDNLGVHLTYTLSDFSARADGPAADGQAAIWTAPVATSAPMTVTVTNQAPSGSRHAALCVTVLTGAAAVGAHGKSGSASASSIAQAYTAQATGGWGFIAVIDWSATGVQTAGTGCFLEGSANVGTPDITYGFLRRTTADDVNTVSNTLNVTVGGTSTNLRWAYAEITPAALVTQSGRVQPLVVSPPFTPVPIPAVTIGGSPPLGNPAVGSPQPLLVTPPYVRPPVPGALLFGLAGVAVTPPPIVVTPPFRAVPVPGAVITANPAAPVVSTASTPNAIIVTPPYAPVPIPAVTTSASQPLGNPAVPTPQPLVVTTAWSAKVPGASISSNPAAPVISTTATPNALVVTPPFATVPVPGANISASQPLGNSAVPTPPPLIVTTPWTASVPGAKLYGPGAPPAAVSTTSSPQPLIVTPPFTPVPVPLTYLSASQPLGNPAVGTPQLLLVTPTFTLSPVPGAKVFAASPATPATPTPGPLVVTPPWQPVAMPKSYLSASFPLGNLAVRSPQPLVVGPPFRWQPRLPVLLGVSVLDHFCPPPTVRPNTGTASRPTSGTTVYGLATTSRPNTGTAARPDTGTTSDC